MDVLVEMKLAAVGVRDHGGQPPPSSPDRDCCPGCHARWQRLQHPRRGVIAGFAIPYRIYWHFERAQEARLAQGQSAYRKKRF
jgi:hypothetical protein